MPKLNFTPQDLKNYRKGDLRHVFYDRSCQTADAIKVHSEGLFDAALLRNRRPNEPIQVFEYRKMIFEAITKPSFTRVFSSLQKIRRSGDWNIDYGDKENEFTKISPGEKLSDYCEEDFPYFKSVTNWIFNLELRKYMIDANAVMLVMPLDTQPQENERLEPFPVIFDSHYVLDFREEDFCVLKNPAGTTYYSQGSPIQGESYYFVSTERIQRYDQADGRYNFNLNLDYVHELGFMPAQKLGGVIIDQAADQFFYESRIAAMVPELNEAMREYSDLQAAKVLHIYPERWEYSNIECPQCQGKARVINPVWVDDCVDCGPQWLECSTCHGTGIFKNAGPYEKMMIRPNNTGMGEAPTVPIPPAGFIEKDVEIIKIQDTGVTDHIYRALAAINFEFLANTPLNQSGTAKEVDKDELNNTVNSFAEDVVKTMDFLYKTIAYYRYGYQYGYDGEIDEMLPNIAVPVSYDLLGNYASQSTLVQARAAGANPVILNALEAEYASKVFYSNPEVKDNLLLELTLDPLPNVAQSDKVLMLTNKGIDQLTFTMSCSIHQFIQRALDEHTDFLKMDPGDQSNIIEGYAQEMIDAQLAAIKVQRSIFNASSNGLFATDQDSEDIIVANQNDPEQNQGALDRLNRQQNSLNPANQLLNNGSFTPGGSGSY